LLDASEAGSAGLRGRPCRGIVGPCAREVSTVAGRPAAARHVLTILAVSDLARATAFYEEAFGWPRLVDTPVYVELALPDRMRLGLYQREGFGRNTGQEPVRLAPDEIGATELYFHVDALSEAIERLRAAGARTLGPLAARDWGDEAAYFADPDGNVLVVARPLSEGALEGGAADA
jgi:catechol 2,3-dioxygenase-like lactoylglutathione lyase family enzyme